MTKTTVRKVSTAVFLTKTTGVGFSTTVDEFRTNGGSISTNLDELWTPRVAISSTVVFVKTQREGQFYFGAICPTNGYTIPENKTYASWW